MGLNCVASLFGIVGICVAPIIQQGGAGLQPPAPPVTSLRFSLAASASNSRSVRHLSSQKRVASSSTSQGATCHSRAACNTNPHQGS